MRESLFTAVLFPDPTQARKYSALPPILRRDVLTERNSLTGVARYATLSSFTAEPWEVSE